MFAYLRPGGQRQDVHDGLGGSPALEFISLVSKSRNRLFRLFTQLPRPVEAAPAAHEVPVRPRGSNLLPDKRCSMLRAQPGAAARRGSRRARTGSSGELRRSGLRARLPPAAGRAMPRDGRRHPRAPRAGHSRDFYCLDSVHSARYAWVALREVELSTSITCRPSSRPLNSHTFTATRSTARSSMGCPAC